MAHLAFDEQHDSFFNPELVIYIPRMNTFWANPEKIREIFQRLDIGEVGQVEIIKKKVSERRKQERQHVGGNYIHSAHVHFNEWYETVATRNLQARILDPNREARIVFDDPWYWLLVESEKTKNNMRFGKNERNTKMLLQKVNRLENIVGQHISACHMNRRNEEEEEAEEPQPLWYASEYQPSDIADGNYYENLVEMSANFSSAFTAEATANHVLNTYNTSLVNDINIDYRNADFIPVSHYIGDNDWCSRNDENNCRNILQEFPEIQCDRLYFD